MKKLKLLLIGVILTFLTNPAFSLDLPAPPSGFDWVEAPEIKGAFLKPHGWYFKAHKQGEIQGYFIAKEDINQDGSFLTGMSVHVIPNIPQKQGISPTEFAFSFIRLATESREILKDPWSHDMGPFKSFGVVLINLDPQGNYNTHNLVIANDQTGTAYIVTYEAPTHTWKEAWGIGETMLGKLLIDSDI